MTGEILAHGQVRRRQLDIMGTTVQIPNRLLVKLDLLADSGVLVSEILPGGAADRAGLQPDDIVVSINGRIVTSVDDIHRLLNSIPRDHELLVSLIRTDRLIARTMV